MSIRERGTVKLFNPERGYGFLIPELGGLDVFLHISNVETTHRPIVAGDKLEYELVRDQRSGKIKAGMVRHVAEGKPQDTVTLGDTVDDDAVQRLFARAR